MIGASLIGPTVKENNVESDSSPSETNSLIFAVPFQALSGVIVNNESIVFTSSATAFVSVNAVRINTSPVSISAQ